MGLQYRSGRPAAIRRQSRHRPRGDRTTKCKASVLPEPATLDGDKALDAGACCQNCGVRWIDDGCEFLDTEHAEVRNGTGAALIVRRQELAGPDLGGKLFQFNGDGAQLFGLGVAQNRRE